MRGGNPNWNSDGLAALRAGPRHNPEPPDDPFDYLDEYCSERGCGYQAVDQDFYDAYLCPTHLKEAVEWDRGE